MQLAAERVGPLRQADAFKNRGALEVPRQVPGGENILQVAGGEALFDLGQNIGIDNGVQIADCRRGAALFPDYDRLKFKRRCFHTPADHGDIDDVGFDESLARAALHDLGVRLVDAALFKALRAESQRIVAFVDEQDGKAVHQAEDDVVHGVQLQLIHGAEDVMLDVRHLFFAARLQNSRAHDRVQNAERYLLLVDQSFHCNEHGGNAVDLEFPQDKVHCVFEKAAQISRVLRKPLGYIYHGIHIPFCPAARAEAVLTVEFAAKPYFIHGFAHNTPESIGKGMRNMFISLVRTIILYLAIVLAVRIMGKRQISQLQTSELVVTMLISDLAVIPMQDSGQPLFSGIIPIFVLIALEVMLSFIMLKSGKVRRAICGKPVVIIQDGRLLQENMRELRMSVEDLFEQLRQKDVFALNDIAYAIVETNGMLSVVKKPEVDYLRPVDAGVRPEPDELEVVVVSDGRLSEGSLQLFGKDDAWVRKILKKENTPLKEVFILTVNNTGNYTLVKKQNAAKKGVSS